jgi:HEAT repeat protein
MKKESRKRKATPPSVPDSESPPGKYDEEERPRAPDQAPPGKLQFRDPASLAELRLQVEELLQRREAPPPEAWDSLGDNARALLIQMLDDVAVSQKPALRQRVIATLGQLGVGRAVGPLGEILLSRSEDAITRAQAANALGRLQDPQAISPLARGVRDPEIVVRRQIALALGRVNHPDAIAHLEHLAADKSSVVAEAASRGLQSCEQALGIDLKIKKLRAARPEKKREPVAEK